MLIRSIVQVNRTEPIHPPRCAAAVIGSGLLCMVIAAGSSAQSSGQSPPKSKGTSWKIPPSTPGKSAPPTPAGGGSAAGSKDSATEPSGSKVVPAASSDGPSRGEVARIAHHELAKAGNPGPWNDTLTLFIPDENGALPVGTFPSGSSPSILTLGDGSIGLFFQRFPLGSLDEFASIAMCRSVDAGSTWSSPRAVQVTGLGPDIEGPLFPAVVAMPDGNLRMFFALRDHSVDPPRSRLKFAESTDDGATWAAQQGELDLDGAQVQDLSVLKVAGVDHLFAPVFGKPGSALHATVREGRFAMRPEVSTKSTGEWSGGGWIEDGKLVFLGAPGAGAASWSARSTDGARWEIDEAPIDFKAPSDAGESVVDVGRFTVPGTKIQLCAAVSRRSAGTPQAASDSGVAAGSEGIPSSPSGSEGVSDEPIPSGRRQSDPVATPQGLEVRPLGGKGSSKKSTAPGSVPGPTPPPIGP